MKVIRNKYLIGLIGIFISIFIVVYLFKNYDINKSISIISETSVLTILLMIVCYLVTFIFRTLRWQLMLNNIASVKYPILLKSIFTGFACNNILPARAGEIIRMKHLNSFTSISNTSAISSIFLEKILDAAILFFLLTTAAFLNKDLISGKLPFDPDILFIISAILILIAFFFRNKILSLAKNILKGKDKKPGSVLKKIHEAFGFAYKSNTFFKVIGLSLIIWIIEGTVFMIAISGFGINQSLLSISFFTLCLVNFSILIPSSPGYIGVFQAAILFSLSIFGIEPSKSLAIALVVHACQFLPVTLIGVPIVIHDLVLPWVRLKRS